LLEGVTGDYRQRAGLALQKSKIWYHGEKTLPGTKFQPFHTQPLFVQIIIIIIMIIIIIIINVTILWNQQIQTDRTISNNKPDIINRDNEKGTCMLIEVAI